MLINLTNHPSSSWSISQRETTSLQFGTIRDIPFPNIPPDWNTEDVETLAKEYFEQITSITNETGEKPVIHIAGEPVFCFILINMLLDANFSCVTSTTERIVIEENNVKTATFMFKQFRSYRTK